MTRFTDAFNLYVRRVITHSLLFIDDKKPKFFASQNSGQLEKRQLVSNMKKFTFL